MKDNCTALAAFMSQHGFNACPTPVNMYVLALAILQSVQKIDVMAVASSNVSSKCLAFKHELAAVSHQNVHLYMDPQFILNHQIIETP